MLGREKLQSYLNLLLEPHLFQDWCPNGLQVEGSENIQHIAVAVSASLETINKAIEIQAQALIVHHGLFWQKDSYVVTGIKKDKIKKLLDHGISLFAYHLPLDAHSLYGNNWKAAQDLGWKNLSPFYPIHGIPLGVKGTFEPMKVEEFAKSLENYYSHPAYSALGGKKEVESAALISGGSHRQILEAIQAGVDCFISGSFDEPVWHQAFEGKINFFALGHAATEKIGPYALVDHLHAKYNIQVTKIQDDNPF